MRRRRSKRRDDKLIELAIVIAVLVAGIISIISGMSSGKFNSVVFFVVLIITLAVLLTIVIILSRPSVIGKIGEKRVSRRLYKIAKQYEGAVIDDVIIPGENGRTSQIDHILVCEYGIFVVETKNYAGRIYGSDKDKERTQVLAYGHSKTKMYNPLKQNETHIYRLKEALKTNVSFYSVIVFVNGNTQYINSEYVWSLADLKHLISEEDEKEISKENVKEIYEAIMEYKNNPVKTNKEHIEEVKKMRSDIENGICPRCGGQLVLRKGNRGEFYGCSNFPKCKFTKNM